MDVPRSADTRTRLQKLRDMAAQRASPQEAENARRALERLAGRVIYDEHERQTPVPEPPLTRPGMRFRTTYRGTP